jgi:hypothetical protein
MENLKNKIQSDLTEALKSQNVVVRDTLRVLSAAILSKEKEKRYKISKDGKVSTEEELTKKSVLIDEEVMDVIVSEAKKRKESILEFEKGKRDDLAKKEKQELEVLQKYLPEQLPEEEVKKLVKEAVENTGAKEIKDMGKVMAALMPKIKGRADGGMISKIVKDLLSPK